jgi:hypothetical protein
MNEKRKSERYDTPEIPVKISFYFSGKKIEAKAKVKDISQGGVFITLDGALFKGTKVELIFEGLPVACVVTDNKKQQKGCGLKVISEGQAKSNYEMFVEIIRQKSNERVKSPEQKIEKSAPQNVRKKTILFIASEPFGFGDFLDNQKVDANFDLLKCETESKAKEALKSGEVVLILIASMLTPSASGIKFLENLIRDGHDLTNIPVIFIGSPLCQHERDTVMYMGINFEYLERGQANPAGLRPKLNKLLRS